MAYKHFVLGLAVSVLGLAVSVLGLAVSVSGLFLTLAYVQKNFIFCVSQGVYFFRLISFPYFSIIGGMGGMFLFLPFLFPFF